MKRILLTLLLTGVVGTSHAKELMPQDAHLAGSYIMATYIVKLLSESRCGKYTSFGEIDATRVQNEVIHEFPIKAQGNITSAINSKEFKRGTKLTTYGGIEGLLRAQMKKGMSQELACAKVSGALEQSFRTAQAQWFAVLKKRDSPGN